MDHGKFHMDGRLGRQIQHRIRPQLVIAQPSEAAPFASTDESLDLPKGIGFRPVQCEAAFYTGSQISADVSRGLRGIDKQPRGMGL